MPPSSSCGACSAKCRAPSPMFSGAFAEKLGLKVYGPKPCEAKMRERADIAGTLEAIPPDPSARIEPVAGAKTGEPAIIVISAGGRRVSLLASLPGLERILPCHGDTVTTGASAALEQAAAAL